MLPNRLYRQTPATPHERLARLGLGSDRCNLEMANRFPRDRKVHICHVGCVVGRTNLAGAIRQNSAYLGKTRQNSARAPIVAIGDGKSGSVRSQGAHVPRRVCRRANQLSRHNPATLGNTRQNSATRGAGSDRCNLRWQIGFRETARCTFAMSGVSLGEQTWPAQSGKTRQNSAKLGTGSDRCNWKWQIDLRDTARCTFATSGVSSGNLIGRRNSA